MIAWIRRILGIKSPAEQLQERIAQDLKAYMSGFDAMAARLDFDVAPWQREIVKRAFERRLQWQAANPAIGHSVSLAALGLNKRETGQDA